MWERERMSKLVVYVRRVRQRGEKISESERESQRDKWEECESQWSWRQSQRGKTEEWVREKSENESEVRVSET